MIIVGEKINGMFKEVRNAIKERNKQIIQKLAKDQTEAKADFLDVNVGPASENPEETMKWLVETIQEVVDTPLAIDSPKPSVIKAGLENCKKKAMINSTTCQKEKIDTLMPLAKEYNASIICLTMDEKGIPRDSNARIELALQILAFANEYQIPIEEVYIDPIILPVNVSQATSGYVLEAIQQIHLLSVPAPYTIIGLSNVSQKANNSELINRTYLVMCMAKGLSAAILNPLDKQLKDALITAEILLNKNIYCDSFLKA